MPDVQTAVDWASPPPAAKQKRGETRALAAQLRKRPNEWARYPRDFGSTDSARAFAYRVRHGKSAFGQHFDAEPRTEAGLHRVYVRFTPPRAEPEPTVRLDANGRRHDARSGRFLPAQRVTGGG